MIKYKEGDLLYVPAINEIGECIGFQFDYQWHEPFYTLRMQDGRKVDALESNCKLADYGKKTAFLTELAELLRKYDANIEPTGYEIEGLYIGINNNKDGVYYKMDEYSPMHELTPDNIFDYEKE